MSFAPVRGAVRSSMVWLVRREALRWRDEDKKRKVGARKSGSLLIVQTDILRHATWLRVEEAIASFMARSLGVSPD